MLKEATQAAFQCDIEDRARRKCSLGFLLRKVKPSEVKSPQGTDKAFSVSTEVDSLKFREPKLK